MLNRKQQDYTSIHRLHIMEDDNRMDVSLSGIINAVSSFSSQAPSGNAIAGATNGPLLGDALNSAEAVLDRLVGLMVEGIQVGSRGMSYVLSSILELRNPIAQYKSSIKKALQENDEASVMRNGTINAFLYTADMSDAPQWFAMVEMVYPVLPMSKAWYLTRALKKWGSTRIHYGKPYRFDYDEFAESDDHKNMTDDMFHASLGSAVKEHAENVTAIKKFVMWCLTRDRSSIEVRIHPSKGTLLADFPSWFQTFMVNNAVSYDITDPSIYIINVCIDQIEAPRKVANERILRSIADNYWREWVPVLSFRFPGVFNYSAAQLAAMRADPRRYITLLLRFDSSADDLQRMIQATRATDAQIEDALNTFGLEYTPNN